MRSTWRVRLARWLAEPEIREAERRRGVAAEILAAVPEKWEMIGPIWEQYTLRQARRKGEVQSILEAMADNRVIERSVIGDARYYRLRHSQPPEKGVRSRGAG